MKRYLSRGEKGLGLICAIIISGLAGVGITRARLDAEPNWNIPAATPTPQPNGFDLYMTASAAIIRANPWIDPEGDTQLITDPKIIAVRYSLARRTAWIQKNARAWALFQQAQAADSLYPQDRSGESPFMGYSAMSKLARSKVALANTAKMRGDWNGAAQNGLDIVEMGGDFGRGAPSLGSSLSLTIESFAVPAFHELPPHLSGAEASRAVTRLEILMRVRQSAVETMREEKWEGLCRLRARFRDDRWRQFSSNQTSQEQQLRDQLISKREIVASYIRAADWAIANVQQPYRSLPLAPPQLASPINRLFNPGDSFTRFDFAHGDVRLDFLLLRLALRAYQADKGGYPKTLNELTSGYVNKVPLDPFGNETPFGYKRKGDSYLLWSVGPDGKDDGGQAVPLTGGRKFANILSGSRKDLVAAPEQQPR